jgi:endonuclease/exonuclease/phosphatase family metal-dependent hydrolase
MKKLSLIDKLLFTINSITAAALLLSYFSPYISPKTIPFLAIISLTVPFLIFINILFFLYWLITLKKQVFLPGLALIVGWLFPTSFYEFSEKKVLLNDDIKVMSYNVRMFNHYKWSDDKEITQKAFDFIQKTSSDILLLQEFYESPDISFTYPNKYIKTRSKKNKFGLAIYSKYKIINSGSLNFENSANNIIYADLKIKDDTVRVYNIHLESLKINPNKENFGEENSEKLLSRLQSTFKKQANQAEQFLAHEKKWNGKKIIAGDFNNTAFSWVYKKIRQNKKDAFMEAGKGFGKSFDYPFPLRIDFIFTDNSININSFKTFDVAYSDHFPILTRINW